MGYGFRYVSAANPPSRLQGANSTGTFQRDEAPWLAIKYVATQRIERGDELFLDYGEDWEKAWQAYYNNQNHDKSPFRHEMGFDIFPKKWLENETRNEKFPTIATPKLAPGEIRPVQLTNGEVLSENINRVGLPIGLSEKMAAWSEEMGITDVMKSYLFGRELDIGAEERVRINGGNWWLKRFSNEWRSNLFCMLCW